MTVQELIDDLLKVEDKSKEARTIDSVLTPVSILGVAEHPKIVTIG